MLAQAAFLAGALLTAGVALSRRRRRRQAADDPGSTSQNDGAAELVTLEEIVAAQAYIKARGDILRTPLLPAAKEVRAVGSAAGTVSRGPEIYLKLESLQSTGSFKIRGMTNCFRVHEKAIRSKGAVTLSAGNAGASFAALCGELGVVCMPETVPQSRVEAIRRTGAKVELMPSVKLMEAVSRHVDAGRVLIHPFDDKNLIAGHGSVGLEILEDMPDLNENDTVAVCCGGGGLVSGVAAALKLSGCKARVVAVEPEGSPCMSVSLQLGRPAREPEDFQSSTIAHGLAPPFAGTITYSHVKAFADDVVTVSDKALESATRKMYGQGYVCETSGCAGVAAAIEGKLSHGHSGRVVCVVSGRNITCRDLYDECFAHH